MRFIIQHHLKGQTPFGLFHNLFTPGDCDGIKYIDLHLGQTRIEFMFREFWRAS